MLSVAFVKKLETIDHIFFPYIVAKFLWACFNEALGWDRIPTGLQDFLDAWIPLGCKDYSAKLFFANHGDLDSLDLT